jgi:quinol monooxygenase YgiN
VSETPVTVIAVIKVKAGAEEQARQLLAGVVNPTLAEPGCLAYDLHQSAGDPAEFMFYERWESDVALAAHASSTLPHRAALREQLGPLVAAPPQVTRWREVR